MKIVNTDYCVLKKYFYNFFLNSYAEYFISVPDLINSVSLKISNPFLKQIFKDEILSFAINVFIISALCNFKNLHKPLTSSAPYPLFHSVRFIEYPIPHILLLFSTSKAQAVPIISSFSFLKTEK